MSKKIAADSPAAANNPSEVEQGDQNATSFLVAKCG
jgi:hypothetical protein